jgi:ribosome-binding protein aMBF1 (putative translation factor)
MFRVPATRKKKPKKPSKTLVLTVERQRKGWSGLELARRSENAPSDLSRWEHARAIPYDRQLRRLARALAWPVADAHRLLEEVAGEDRNNPAQVQ